MLHLGLELGQLVLSLDLDVDNGIWITWAGTPLVTSVDSPPGLAVESGGLTATTAGDSFSPTKVEEAGTEPPDGEFWLVETTKYCGLPCDPDLTRPLLAIWCALPLAAAAKCWIIRSSSSASFSPAGDCNEKCINSHYVEGHGKKNHHLFANKSHKKD